MSGKDCLRLISGIISGAVFCVSSILKLSDLDSFKIYVYSLIPVSYTLVEIIVYALIGLELCVGACLILGIARKESGAVGLLALSVFSGFLIWRIINGDSGNCHCLGSSVQMGPVVSIMKNILLALLMIPSLGAGRSSKTHLALAAALYTAAVLLAGFVSFPDFAVKEDENNDEIDEQLFLDYMRYSAAIEDEAFVSFLSVDCAYCKKYISKLSTLVSHGVIPEQSVWIVFMDQGISSEDIDSFFSKHAKNEGYHYSSLTPDKFLPIVRGSMPTGVLIRDGKIIKVFNLVSLGKESKIRSLFHAPPP